jgi:hypothetical protein
MSETSPSRDVGSRVWLLLLLVCCGACPATGGSVDGGASVPPDARGDEAGADASAGVGLLTDGGRTGDAALALDGGDATGDPRCSLANCQNLFACGFTLPAAPDVSGCARRSGHTPDPADGLAYCPAACNAGATGPALACLAAPATMCSVSCAGPDSSDPHIVACSIHCDDIRSACRDACPASSYHACLDCTFHCSVVALSCYAGCAPARDGGQP